VFCPECGADLYLRRRVLRRELIAYGVDPADPRLAECSTDDLQDWHHCELDAFRNREHAWWNATLSPEGAQTITEGAERYSLGGAPAFPFVTRPFDYAVYSGYPGLPVDDERALIDRGLVASRDAETRHFILLAGLKREYSFHRSLDPVAQERLLRFSREMRTNRPQAVPILAELPGGIPPDWGEEFDAMPFTIVERRVAYTYRRRNEDPDAIEHNVAECRAMIARSPEFIALFRELGLPLPTHKGFEQLAIILDKQGDTAEALAVSEQAQSEGWAGDWDNRIARYGKRLVKQQAREHAR
jgi:hypothetical protein